MSFIVSLCKTFFRYVILILLLTVLCLIFFSDEFHSIWSKPGNAEAEQLKTHIASLNFEMKQTRLRLEQQRLRRDSIGLTSPLQKAAASWEYEKTKLQLDVCEKLHDMYKVQEAALQRKAQSTLVKLRDWFFDQWGVRGWTVLASVCLALIGLPILSKLLLYYVIAPAVEKVPPLSLEASPDSPPVTFSPAETCIHFKLPEHSSLFLRAKGGDWGKVRKNVHGRTKFLWSWKAPLVSLAADLAELYHYTSLPGQAGEVKLTSPTPDAFLMAIHLNGKSGVVVRPKYLIGLTSDVKVRTHWSLNLHNILSGRIRRIIFYGTGTIFISGNWGVDAREAVPATAENRDISKIEDNLLLAYDSRAKYSFCRTQTFWHFFRGSSSLFDYQLEDGTFFTQNSPLPSESGSNRHGIERFVDGVFSNIGMLFGF